jgi:hypothetical protein
MGANDQPGTVPVKRNGHGAKKELDRSKSFISNRFKFFGVATESHARRREARPRARPRAAREREGRREAAETRWRAVGECTWREAARGRGRRGRTNSRPACRPSGKVATETASAGYDEAH